jgi:predicted outer membrane protein
LLHTAKKEKLSDADLPLIAHYHAVNLMEIDLGKLAAKRGTTPAIKQYGDMHKAADAQKATPPGR